MTALARVETVRMLRHPVTVVAILFLAGSWVSAWFAIGTTRYPVLPDLARDSAIGMMVLLGGAALIVGNLAVLRAHRDGTEGLSQVLILPDRARTLAHLFAPLPLAVLGAVLIVARMAVLANLTPAAGHPNPYELAAGPATILLLGALGVLLGRLTRSAVVAPLALLVLLAGLVALDPLARGGKALWLAPQGGSGLPMAVPVSLLGRPAAAHLAYLLGLAGLLAVAALLRSRRPRLPGRPGRGGGAGAARWRAARHSCPRRARPSSRPGPRPCTTRPGTRPAGSSGRSATAPSPGSVAGSPRGTRSCRPLWPRCPPRPGPRG